MKIVSDFNPKNLFIGLRKPKRIYLELNIFYSKLISFSKWLRYVSMNELRTEMIKNTSYSIFCLIQNCSEELFSIN